ncbi:TraB/GumN family protein [Mucilaginibacter terrae]|uniref:Uncharacterized protein YbaP (TraB family) n=1 Tax=Mucilaginibacter terrae TaxID=1955052 RepID=A0ABU3GYU4_9SPHI|nr:TraB/GumN family protein [Mucilaginibacter terrae]MDT3404939.1 uncharacterized protein YbaP (TraB family) [Mucilaginibacter terrae]
MFLLSQLTGRGAKLSFNKHLFVFLLTLLFSFQAFSQSGSNYNLLWRISGKNLKKPSYLLGTIHTKNKHAFGYSDSVVLALQKCDAFARELHPDSTVAAAYRASAAEEDSKLRKALSASQYSTLAQRFEDKKGYPIAIADAYAIQDLLKTGKGKPDEKNTFADDYLYGIARTLHKNIYGLEKFDDQIAWLSNEDKIITAIEAYVDDKPLTTGDAFEEKLAELYVKGNLDNISKYLEESSALDAAWVTRNKNMLNSMLGVMPQSSLFTSVGVAHLPGKDGLIALLQAQGYTVTPVQSAFSGISSQFKPDPLVYNWATFNNKEDGFSIDIPGLAMLDDKGAGIKAVVYPDLSTGMVYGASAFNIGEKQKAANNLDALKQAFARYKQNVKNKYANEKSVTVNGLPGIQFLQTDSLQTVRMQFVLGNNKLYLMYVGNRPDLYDQPYANKFFNSLKTFKTAAAPVPQSTWIPFNHSKGAFSVLLPGEPQDMRREVPNPADTTGPSYVLNMYMASDVKNGKNYIVRYNDLPTGMYMKDLTTAYESVFSTLKNNGKLLNKPTKVVRDGVEGRAVKMLIKDAYHADVEVYIRGNRQYMLLRQSSDNKPASPDEFFGSLRFTPYEPSPEYIYKPADGAFSVDMFTIPRTIIDTAESTSFIFNSTTTHATDPSSGNVYLLEYAKISPYYKTPHVDSLYHTLIHNMVNYTDTLLKVDTVMFGTLKGREFITQNKTTLDKRRHRILFDNASMVFMTGRMNSTDYFTPVSDRFFSSYTSLSKTPAFDYAALKGEKILTDVRSTDTSVVRLARGALSYYKFDKTELPQVYAALKKIYPDDTLERGVRYRLLGNLEDTHDAQTLTELEALYNTPGTADIIKMRALAAIPYLDKKEGYDLYLKNLTGKTFVASINNYELFRPLNDSLEYTAANFSKLLPLLPHPQYRHHIVRLAKTLMHEDDKPAYKQLVKSNFATLTQYAGQDFDKYATDTTVTAYNTGVVAYMGLMDAPAPDKQLVDQLTSILLKRGHAEPEMLSVALARIANNLPMPKLINDSLLRTLYTRHEIMNAYNKVGQLSKVPVKYTTPAEFGRVCMYNYAGANSEDDEYPETTTLLGNVTYKGQNYFVYKFTYNYEDEVNEYIGVYRPQKAGAKLDFKNYNCYTDWNAKKKNWQQQAIKMIAGWKKQK